MSTSEASAASQAAEAAPTRPHLHFLDGIRGLAALFVVFAHVFIIASPLSAYSWRSPIAALLFHISGLAHVALGAFIALSGFCLMLPVVWSREHALAGGVNGFIARRSRRILPPYYAAVALSILLPYLHIALLNLLKKTRFPWPDAPEAGAFVSHLFLIHNLRLDWIGKLDFPTWSIATEWQIYFVFALVLLPIWKRAGNVPVLLISLVIGLLPHFALSGSWKFDWACPWFVIVFAEGMIAAALVFSPNLKFRKNLGKPAVRIPAALFAIAVYFPFVWWTFPVTMRWYSLLDVFAALPILYLIVCCVDAALSNSPQKTFSPFAILGKPLLVRLGTMSYSLYLIHWPILLEVSPLTRFFAHHGIAASPAIWLIVIGLPASLAAAYCFHVVFERPFLKRRAA